jgi:hypothetical protein
METLSVRLQGATPLLVNNPSTVNPLSETTKIIKELSGKRKKSDQDVTELLRMKYHASLYYDAELGPYIPAYNAFRCGQEGGKLSKQGKNWERGVTVIGDKAKLNYKGPREPEELWDTPRFVDIRDGSIGTSRVTVARPIFNPEWSCDVTFMIAPDVVNSADVLANLVTGGRLIGIGTYRARFGRFTVELINSSTNIDRACDNLGVVRAKGN